MVFLNVVFLYIYIISSLSLSLLFLYGLCGLSPNTTVVIIDNG